MSSFSGSWSPVNEELPRVLDSQANCCCLFAVLHDDVRSVHPVRSAVVYVGSLLLERSAEDPVLDRRGHFPGDGGEGGLLRRI